jgi:hypothetical protein
VHTQGVRGAGPVSMQCCQRNHSSRTPGAGMPALLSHKGNTLVVLAWLCCGGMQAWHASQITQSAVNSVQDRQLQLRPVCAGMRHQ